MAVYVTSDLHGFSIKKFKQLLKVIDFSHSDWLYILGDVIDRNNDGGIAILLWLLEQPNVQLIRGNHEQMMLSCSWVFSQITDEASSSMSVNDIENLDRWLANGAKPTLSAIKHLLHTSPESVEDIMAYLSDTPLCESVEVNGQSFLLCHSGFQNFDENKKILDYSDTELLWNRPDKEERYFDDVLTVIGHTPTSYYGCIGKAFRTDTWIDIDVGVSDGAAPMFLRLDDMKEIYF